MGSCVSGVAVARRRLRRQCESFIRKGDAMNFTVNVDPTNPGQFFACCGLLELADRLWGGAEGWFADGKFQIASGGTLAETLDALLASEPEEVTTLDDGLKVKPLIAPLRLSFDGIRPFRLT